MKDGFVSFALGVAVGTLVLATVFAVSEILQFGREGLERGYLERCQDASFAWKGECRREWAD